jgi:hypothetical protein
MLQTQFYPVAKLRRVTLDTLRHSCALIMIANGAPITEVKHQLWPCEPSITWYTFTS